MYEEYFGINSVGSVVVDFWDVKWPARLDSAESRKDGKSLVWIWINIWGLI